MARAFLVSVYFCLGLMVCLSCGGDSADQEKPAPSSPAVNPEAAEQILRDAALECKLDVMAAAVEGGARIDACDGDGRTALMYASFNGHTECVRWLLDRGANVGIREGSGRTALMFGSTGPFAGTVELLLDSGANPNEADEYEGWTALMFAAGEGQVEVAQVLLAHGANPSVIDKDGEVAADHAGKNGHSEVERLLREAVQER